MKLMVKLSNNNRLSEAYHLIPVPYNRPGVKLKCMRDYFLGLTE